MLLHERARHTNLQGAAMSLARETVGLEVKRDVNLDRLVFALELRREQGLAWLPGVLGPTI
jgi:hypothetical protein